MPLHHELKGYIKYEEANTEWYHETRRFGVGAYSPYLAGIARLHCIWIFDFLIILCHHHELKQYKEPVPLTPVSLW